jgi:hypothetical protein
MMMAFDAVVARNMLTVLWVVPNMNQLYFQTSVPVFVDGQKLIYALPLVSFPSDYYYQLQ